MWVGNAPLGEDRKNVGLLIKLFLELFKNKKNTPALILKTSTVSASYTDRKEILKRIDAIKKTVVANTLPNIYLLHGEFTDDEINNLYNHPKVKCMVSLTKGEGWGRTFADVQQASNLILDMFDNYKKYIELAKRQGYHTRNNFSFENMKDKLKSILDAIPTPVKQIQLTLPKLKKIEQ